MARTKFGSSQNTITEELSSYFVCDEERAAHVANWVYAIAENNGSKFWLAARDAIV